MEGLNISWISLAFNIAHMAGLGMVAFYAHLVQKSKVNASAIQAVKHELAERIEDARDRVSSVERRVDVAESQLSNMPTHHDLGRLYQRLNTVAEDTRQMTGEVRSIAHQLSMISEYLLQRSGGDSK